MRMSCNGCRVLRKACSEDCTIRPCLEWIKSPESQANATVFLAKFYGRAGLINLINAGPYHLRPAIFRSLLFEACGRIVNRVSGVTGLICSGSWRLCEAAVEAVLEGAPIIQISSDSESGQSQSPLKASDIRHVSKDESSTASDQLHKVRSTRSRFKRSALKPKPEVEYYAVSGSVQLPWLMRCDNEFGESGVNRRRSGGESGESDRVSVETVEASLVERADCSGLDLDLNLGLWS